MQPSPPLTIPYRSVQRVYFDDLDALGILHNLRYLLLLERARGDLFRHLGVCWGTGGPEVQDNYCVVAEQRIRYLAAVRGEGDVCATLVPTHLGTSSLVINGHVESPDAEILYAEATARLVRLDPATNRPCPWSDRFRAAMTPLLRTCI